MHSRLTQSLMHMVETLTSSPGSKLTGDDFKNAAIDGKMEKLPHRAEVQADFLCLSEKYR